MLFNASSFDLLDLNATSSDQTWFNESGLDVNGDSGDEVLECPVYSHGDDRLLDSVTFWVDGVVTCIMAFTGLIANIISALILGKEDMRNSFNFLLIALICMDSCYLVASILESFRRGFNLTTVAHIFLFPYLFYPLLSIAVTGSIFMTVAIAFERYIAVHYPIDYSQAINSPEACKKRLLKYVVPVVFISTLVNVPKFFESYVETKRYPILPMGFRIGENDTIWLNNTRLDKSLLTEEDWNAITGGGFSFEDIPYEVTHNIAVSALRKDPAYTIYYTNWTRLIVTGICPTILLIYFNYKIYKDVKHRNRRQLSMSRTSATATQQARRKQEDNLAVVFMGIVLVFLVCHTPRNLLSLAEMVIIRNAMACQKLGMHGFPIWTLITASISHMLLVVNSSTNMILYIFLNKLFRLHFINLVKSIFGFISRPCSKSANNNDATALAMEPLMNGGHRNGANGGVEAAAVVPASAAAAATTVAPKPLSNDSNPPNGKNSPKKAGEAVAVAEAVVVVNENGDSSKGQKTITTMATVTNHANENGIGNLDVVEASPDTVSTAVITPSTPATAAAVMTKVSVSTVAEGGKDEAGGGTKV